MTMTWTHGDYDIKAVDRFEEPLYSELVDRVFFGDFPAVNFRVFATDDELAREKDLKQRIAGRYLLRLGAFHQGQLVGWTVGWQDTDNLFYMANSAVLPEHRRKGIYQQLLQGVLAATKAAGFPAVYSRHLAGNNAVIIPKLKAGFLLSGMEVLEAFGTVVRMTYYHSDLRRECYDFRVGMKKPTERIRPWVE